MYTETNLNVTPHLRPRLLAWLLAPLAGMPPTGGTLMPGAAASLLVPSPDESHAGRCAALLLLLLLLGAAAAAVLVLAALAVFARLAADGS